MLVNSDIREAARKGVCWFVWRAPLLHFSNGYIGTKWAKHQKTKHVCLTKTPCCKCYHPSIHKYTVCSQHSFNLIRVVGKEKGKNDLVLCQHTFFLCNLSCFSLISVNKQDWPSAYFGWGVCVPSYILSWFLTGNLPNERVNSLSVLNIYIKMFRKVCVNYK